MANRRLSRWGSGYIWVEFLNRVLARKNMTFGDYICVRKLRFDDTYIGYFTIKYNTWPGKYKFGQLMVEFEDGKILKKSVILWEEKKKIILELLEPEHLLLDMRDEFTWICPKQVKGVNDV